MSGDGTGKRLVARGRALAHFRMDGETTPNGLLPAEEKLLVAAREGGLCRIDEVRPEQASRDNKIRASFIRFLALGGDTGAPVHEHGVQLRGAFIEDVLDLEGCEGVRPLFLWHCLCERKIVLRDACTRTINLEGSRVLGMQGDRSNISGGVFLRNGFTAQGEVRFLGAEIGGELDCKNGRFENARGNALFCDGAKISGPVFLRNGFTAQGEVRFLGAEIGGQLNCENGRFENASGYALLCDGAKISRNVFLSDGFAAHGEVRFAGAEIGGELDCGGGRFANQRPGLAAATLLTSRVQAAQKASISPKRGLKARFGSARPPVR